MWVPFLCMIWSKYPQRLGMLFYILSRLGSICRGLASAKAWNAILYLVTPWQYLQRLGMLFYILSRLGSICRGLTCYSISYYKLRLGSICGGSACCSMSCHALAVSAEAWHAIPYLITIQDSNPGRVPLFIPGLKKISTWWIDFLSGFRDWCLV